MFKFLEKLFGFTNLDDLEEIEEEPVTQIEEDEV